MLLTVFEQFYILSTRGDSIIFRDFRSDATASKSTVETFYHHVVSSQHCPSIFNLHSTTYIWLRKNTLYFVFTTRYNTSPVVVTELLIRLTKLFKDYLGVLSEECIRSNFVLIYELLDEIIDFGYLQTTNTNALKSYVFNEPIVVKSDRSSASSGSASSSSSNGINRGSSGANAVSSAASAAVSSVVAQAANSISMGNLSLGMGSSSTDSKVLSKTTPSTSVDKSVISADNRSGAVTQDRRNEIYVDIYERISVVLNLNGICLHSSIDGSIQMKSYLYGRPSLKLALNEDLFIGKSINAPYGSVRLDDTNFHECVDLSDFDSNRMLLFQPPEGEFVLMNYRLAGLNHSMGSSSGVDPLNTPTNFSLPFRLFPQFEITASYRCELLLQLRCDIPSQHYAGNVHITVPLPDNTSSVNADLREGSTGQSYEFIQPSANGGAAGSNVNAAPSNSRDRSIAARKVFVWKIKKVKGETEEQCRVRITLDSDSATSISALRRSLSPLTLSFEIPMYNPSGLQVRYLRIQGDTKDRFASAADMSKGKSTNQPYRWVRYVTRSQSYVVRMQ